MKVTATEHGVVRLFAIDLPPAEAAQFDIDALGAALGGVPLDSEQVDLIPIDDLDELGLDGYLIHGIGINKSEVVQLRPQIRAIKGHAAVIRSAAFGGMAATLKPQHPIRWVATFGEVPLDLTPIPMKSESAKKTPSTFTPKLKGKPSNSIIVMYCVFLLISVVIFNIFAR